MHRLLSGAAFNTYYERQQESGVRHFFREQAKVLLTNLEVIREFLSESEDVLPLLGTVSGILLGTFIVLKIAFYFLGPSVTKDQREHYNFLSAISRGDSEIAKYGKKNKYSTKKKSTWSWNLFKSSKSLVSTPSAVFPRGPACYLVYEPDCCGSLVQIFSKTPLDANEHSVLAFWRTNSHISIQKFQEHGGRTNLASNCSVGFQGRHNYCNGVCQFVKGAFAYGEVTITMMPNARKTKKQSDDDGDIKQLIPIDVYLYQHDNRPSYQTLSLRPLKGMPIPSSHSLKAVACLPHKTSFYKKLGVELSQWMADGERYGSSIRI